MINNNANRRTNLDLFMIKGMFHSIKQRWRLQGRHPCLQSNPNNENIRIRLCVKWHHSTVILMSSRMKRKQ